jgi:2-C-methyl-D-erythritol 4-phosphate cytidylyltransferase
MNWLVILAGGSGSRMKSAINKIFLKIEKKPILCWNLKVFNSSPVIDKIIVCSSSKDLKKITVLIKKYNFQKVVKIIETNETRQGNTLNALNWLKNNCKDEDLVGIHNAVNPFVTSEEIENLYSEAKKNKSALLAYPSIDTIKISNEENFAINTPKREVCWSAQTPQVAQFSILIKAHLKAKNDNFVATDDSQLLNLIGIQPKIVECSRNNFKITFPEDIIKSKLILKINPIYATCWNRPR